jgi:CHAT domain-containing protein
VEHEGKTTLDAGVSDLEGSRILTVDVPTTATAVVLDATVSGRSARARIAVVRSEPRPWLDEVRAARAQGDVERASALATAHLDDANPVVRALARGALARIRLGQGRSDEAFPLFREAIELHREAGRISDIVDDSLALSFSLSQRSHRYTEARAALDGIAPELPLYPEGRARAPYYRGTLAGEVGDHRQALALLEEAKRAARRLGMVKLERNCRSAVALELQEIGRVRASIPVLAALEKEYEVATREHKHDAPSPCERAELANNVGWAALLANEIARSEGRVATEDARSSLERAVATDCRDAYVRGFALSNLARAALDDGDFANAERRLLEAKAAVKEPRGVERIAWLELEGRLHFARGRIAQALGVLDDGLALARASLLLQAQYDLLVTRSEVLVAAKRTTDAIASLREAEHLLDSAMVLVPLGEGRASYASARTQGARALVDILVGQGDASGAAAVAERALARVLSSALSGLRLERLTPTERAQWEDAVRAYRTARAALDAEAANDWKLPADALARAVRVRSERERDLRSALERAITLLHARESAVPKPGPSEAALELDLFPDREGFVAIAKRSGKTFAYRLPKPHESRGAEDLARVLLAPLADFIDHADATEPLVVRAYGAWRAVDIHALPWQGEPLVLRHPVVYSIGLGRMLAPDAKDRSLVVGDPTGDLPAALDEARSAAKTFEERASSHGGSASVRLLVRDEATSRAVNEALLDADRLHYAGHGIFAGEEGWESALPLALGGRLTTADILALAHAPRTVVLSGCEAAKSNGDAEGLGLAQAFILAGSAEVLAPIRVVPDELAGEMARALYDREPSAPLGAAARRAVLRLRSENPGSDWAGFRVLVP